MARGTFYQAGHKPQYGKARWARYEYLRESGMTKTEARDLSRAQSPQTLAVIAAMARGREKLVDKFLKDGGGSYLYFVRKIRNWYRRSGLAPKGIRQHKGFFETAKWFHRVENRLAKSKGWRKGKYVEPPPKGTTEFDEWNEQEAERQRRRKKSPTGKHYKGNVAAQRSRAKARSQAFKDLVRGSDDSPSIRKQRRQWIMQLKITARQEPERADKLYQQAKSLGYTGRSF